MSEVCVKGSVEKFIKHPALKNIRTALEELSKIRRVSVEEIERLGRIINICRECSPDSVDALRKMGNYPPIGALLRVTDKYFGSVSPEERLGVDLPRSAVRFPVNGREIVSDDSRYVELGAVDIGFSPEEN